MRRGRCVHAIHPVGVEEEDEQDEEENEEERCVHLGARGAQSFPNPRAITLENNAPMLRVSSCERHSSGSRGTHPAGSKFTLFRKLP